MKKALIFLLFLMSMVGQSLAQNEWVACRMPANIIGKWEQDNNTFVSINQGTVAYVSENDAFNFNVTGVYRHSGRIMIVGIGVKKTEWGEEPTQLTLMVRAGYGANVIEVAPNDSFTTSEVFAKASENQLSLQSELGYAHSR